VSSSTRLPLSAGTSGSGHDFGGRPSTHMCQAMEGPARRTWWSSCGLLTRVANSVVQPRHVVAVLTHDEFENKSPPSWADPGSCSAAATATPWSTRPGRAGRVLPDHKGCLVATAGRCARCRGDGRPAGGTAGDEPDATVEGPTTVPEISELPWPGRQQLAADQQVSSAGSASSTTRGGAEGRVFPEGAAGSADPGQAGSGQGHRPDASAAQRQQAGLPVQQVSRT